jgi:hypothetical protein
MTLGQTSLKAKTFAEVVSGILVLLSKPAYYLKPKTFAKAVSGSPPQLVTYSLPKAFTDAVSDISL